MVTVLESGLLQNFSVVFSFLFVITVMFGILTLTGVFGQNKGLQVIVSFVVALMVLIVPDVNALITTMVPWFTVVFIFILFLLIAYKIFGATDADIMGAVRSNSVIVWIVGILFVIIVLAAFGSVYGQRLLPTTSNNSSTNILPGEGGSTSTSDYNQNVAATFFHPKILGMLFILILGVFTVAILAIRPD